MNHIFAIFGNIDTQANGQMCHLQLRTKPNNRYGNEQRCLELITNKVVRLGEMMEIDSNVQMLFTSICLDILTEEIRIYASEFGCRERADNTR